MRSPYCLQAGDRRGARFGLTTAAILSLATFASAQPPPRPTLETALPATTPLPETTTPSAPAPAVAPSAETAAPSEPAPRTSEPAVARSAASDSTHFSGSQGRVVFSAERVVSLSRLAWKLDVIGESSASVETRGTSVGLLWAARSRLPPDVMDTIDPYATPRLAIDVFIHPNVTLGGSAGYASTSSAGHQTALAGNAVASSSRSAALVVSPRIGAVFSTSSWLAVWVRGGFTYSHCSLEIDGPTNNGISSNPVAPPFSWSQTAISLEPVIVFTLAPHFGVTFGPILDVPVDGSLDVRGTGTLSPKGRTEHRFRLSSYGIAANVLGYF